MRKISEVETASLQTLLTAPGKNSMQPLRLLLSGKMILLFTGLNTIKISKSIKIWRQCDSRSCCPQSLHAAADQKASSDSRNLRREGFRNEGYAVPNMHRPNAQMPTTKSCLKKIHVGFWADGSVCDFDSANWKGSMEQETVGFSTHRSSLPAAQSQRDLNCRYWNSMLMYMGGPARQTENLNSIVELKG